MRLRIFVIGVVSAFALAGAVAAQEVCEPYTQGCTGGGGPVIPPTTIVKAPQGDNPGTPPQGQVSTGGDRSVLQPVAVPSPAVRVGAGGGEVGGQLPLTGADITGLVVLGGALLAGGLLLTRAGRRRPADS